MDESVMEGFTILFMLVATFVVTIAVAKWKKRKKR